MVGNDREVVRVAHSCAADPQRAVGEIAARLADRTWSGVLFFSSPAHSLAEVATAMFAACPDAITVGCTTSGEIGPLGLTSGGISALAFTSDMGFAALPIDQHAFEFRDGGRVVSELARRVGGSSGGLSSERHVFLTLTDGLSGKDELLVASVATHAAGVPLVGGSAGDDQAFRGTCVAIDGRVYSRAAVVMLLEPRVPFETFLVHHFTPTERRVVVTGADPMRRLVHELDGWPALEVLAELLETSAAELRRHPMPLLAARPTCFAFRLGDSWFLRGVMTVRDGGLLMGGAVEEGMVLRWMQRGDLVDATRRGIVRVTRSGGSAAGMLLFNCGGRLLEARAHGWEQALERAMCLPDLPVAGFTTYGEQYGPMQVNSTLTGLVLRGAVEGAT